MKQAPKTTKKRDQKVVKTANLTKTLPFVQSGFVKTTSNNGQNPVKILEQYLSIVHRYTPNDAFLALTTIKDTIVRTRWYQRSQLNDLLSQVLLLDKLQHIYLRVTPVAAIPDHGRGVEADAIGSSVLYVDYDTYGLDVKAAVSRLESLELPPSMIVHSGGGLHLYWLLDTLYTDLAAIKARNKELALMLNRGTDTKLADSCFDLARVLRLPGTHNIKRDPILATIISYHPDRVYSLDQFNPAPLTDQTITQWDADPLPDVFLDTLRDQDKKLYQRILSEHTALKADAVTKADGSIDRSRNDAYIATRLLGLGYSPGQIISVLTHPTWLAGAKYRATGRFDYVVMTANAAYQAFINSPDQFFKKGLVVERLADKLQRSATFMYAGENLYRYEHGVFTPDADQYVKAEVIRYLGPKWTAKASDDTVRWLIDQNRVALTSVNDHKGLINVYNGMLDPTTGDLRTHSPTFRSLAQLPVAYNRSSDPTVLDEFVAAILPADAINVFWEYIGSALLQDQYWPKNFLALVGAGDTGKSKLLKFINLFFGKQNVSNVALQMLAAHRFAGASLFGKYANIFADLSEAEANDPGPIKALTGDDQISGEEKFKGVYFFTNTARLIFSANGYPRIKNPDKWYFKRAIIIPCSHQFDAKTADPNILDKIATTANFEAALVRAVEGVQRLISANGFSHSESIARANAEYRYQADTVSGFLQACQHNPNYVITKQRFYQLYRDACKANHRMEVSADLFYKRVNEYADQYKLTTEYKSMPDGSRAWCYVGLQPEAVPATFTLVMENN